MKLLFGIIVCTILSICTSSFYQCFNPSSGIISTLYTVSGIMFSIGMSLLITINTSGVKNKRIKKGIRKELDVVRNHYIGCFAFVSILFILLSSGIDSSKEIKLYNCYCIKYSHELVLILVYSIAFFIFNFIALQRLNLSIENALNAEESNL